MGAEASCAAQGTDLLISGRVRGQWRECWGQSLVRVQHER